MVEVSVRLLFLILHESYFCQVYLTQTKSKEHVTAFLRKYFITHLLLSLVNYIRIT